MPVSVLDQATAQAELAANPAAAAAPLRAHVSGGHAHLVRYRQLTERAAGRLGYYDPLLDHDYAFPGVPAGAVLDTAFTKVWLQNALLRYFQSLSSSGGDVTKAAGSNNRVRSDSVNFAAAGGTYPRAAALLRDVRAGDVVKVRGLDGGGTPLTLWTYVQALAADAVAGTVGAAQADAANQANEGPSSTHTQTAGDVNCVDLTVDASGYDGRAGGDVVETYTLLVSDGSVGGDFTTATLRVSSASGHDDVAAAPVAAAGAETAVGTRGLKVVFDVNPAAACSASATLEEVSAVDLVAGQTWTVTVHQDFTAAAATAAGGFSGTADVTYVVTVSRGGGVGDDHPASQPQISAAADNGTDVSGPSNVSAAGVAVNVGTLGVTLAFGAGSLRKGDKYYVPCGGRTTGPVRTVVLGHSIDSGISAGSALDLTLFIKQDDLALDPERVGAAPERNWTADAGAVTLKAAATAFDPDWLDGGGAAVALPLASEASQGYGLAFVEYRAWRQDFVGQVFGVSGTDAVAARIGGALDADNPLKWAVHLAALNSGGVEVKYTAVADPASAAAWNDVLTAVAGRDDVYGLVPLTRTPSVLAAFRGHAAVASLPENGVPRVLWLSLPDVAEVPLVSAGGTVPGHTAATTTDGLTALGTFTDDPATDGSQYTLLTCTTGNSAFLSGGVTAGDVVRAGFTSDGFGGVRYDTYLVASVVSETELLLAAGPAAAVSQAGKFEVWRTLTASGRAAALAQEASALGDARVRAVWPDSAVSAGVAADGFFLCAALAGLASGVLPWRALTNLEVAGFSATPRSAAFNSGQLRTLRRGGVWVVATAAAGQQYTVQGVTTAAYADLNAREEMVTRNLDSVVAQFQDMMAPFKGVTNVTKATEQKISLKATSLLDQLQTPPQGGGLLGPQVAGGSVVAFRPSAVQPDQYVLTLNVQLPAPFNDAVVSVTT